MNVTQMALTARLDSRVTDLADLDSLGTSPNARLVIELLGELTNGTGSDQANQVYYDSASLAASARTDYDLAGTLTDVFGATITFTTIRGFMLKNTSTTAAILNLGGGSNGAGLNAFDTWITSAAPDGSEAVIVPKGGCILVYAPDSTAYAVTAGTVDLLSVYETAALAATFEIAIIGSV